MKKYTFFILILLLAGCSSPSWEDRLRVIDEFDEKLIQNQFVLPIQNDPLRFSVNIFGLIDYNIDSEEEAQAKFLNDTWELRTLPLGENAATLEGKIPLYFYSENYAKHMTYKYALKKEDVEAIKKQLTKNELIVAWVDNEHEAVYECEKEHNYKYDDRCGYGRLDKKGNKGDGGFYTTAYDEEIDKKSIALRKKIELERNNRYETWKLTHKNKDIIAFLEDEGELSYSFLPTEYRYYCKKRKDYFYHCKINFHLNLLIAHPK